MRGVTVDSLGEAGRAHLALMVTVKLSLQQQNESEKKDEKQKTC